MKIKDGFVLREVAGTYVAIATGEASKTFRGMIKMNASCAKIWECFKEGMTVDETAQKLTEIYDVDLETAKTETTSTAKQLLDAGIAEE